MQDKLSVMGSGALLPLILRFSWPALITMTLNVLYNVVDRIYIGQGCGNAAIAALSLSMPFFVILASIGVLVGVGSSALLSIKLGEKDMPSAERVLGQCVALKLLLGIVMPPLIYFFLLDPLLQFMGKDGTTPETLRLARIYLSTTLWFNGISHLAFGLSACMRAEGSPKLSMACMLVGFGTNLILDPLFIFSSIPLRRLGIPGLAEISIPGLGMGVAGAAWATNIAMCVSCLTAFSHYVFGRSSVRLRLKCLRLYRDLLPRVLAIGTSQFLMQFLSGLIVFSLNYSLSKWSPTLDKGTENVAAYGIYGAVAMIFLLPMMGIQQGVSPIISYNWGAESFERVKHAFKLGLILTNILAFLAFLGQQIFAFELVRAFAKSDDLLETGTRTVRIASAMIWTIGINVSASSYFQAVGRPRTAIFLSLLRQFVCLLPIVWILPHIMSSQPILAIWLAMPISDVLACVATIWPVIREMRLLDDLSLANKTGGIV